MYTESREGTVIRLQSAARRMFAVLKRKHLQLLLRQLVRASEAFTRASEGRVQRLTERYHQYAISTTSRRILRESVMDRVSLQTPHQQRRFHRHKARSLRHFLRGALTAPTQMRPHDAPPQRAGTMGFNFFGQWIHDGPQVPATGGRTRTFQDMMNYAESTGSIL